MDNNKNKTPKYEARVFGRLTRKCNYEHGELYCEDEGTDGYTTSFPFNTLNELKSLLAQEYTACDNAEIRDYSCFDGDNEVYNTLNWVTRDEDGLHALSEKDKELFKQGKIDVYEHDIFFNIYPFHPNPINRKIIMEDEEEGEIIEMEEEYVNSEDFQNDVKAVVLGETCDKPIADLFSAMIYSEIGDMVRPVLVHKFGEKHGQKYEQEFLESLVTSYGQEVEDAIAAAFVEWLKKHNYIKEN